MSNIHRLPDGSGFFVGEIGPRGPGLINWLKYQPHGCARAWLFFWRTLRTTPALARETGSPMSWWQTFRYAVMITRQLYGR